jgi:hypothetical protein
VASNCHRDVALTFCIYRDRCRLLKRTARILRREKSNA